MKLISSLSELPEDCGCFFHSNWLLVVFRALIILMWGCFPCQLGLMGIVVQDIWRPPLGKAALESQQLQEMKTKHFSNGKFYVLYMCRLIEHISTTQVFGLCVLNDRLTQIYKDGGLNLYIEGNNN